MHRNFFAAMNPEVSVVMSVYNGAKTLAPSIQSILSQADVNFEFVIIDDGSTDGSAAIIDEFARQDSRIKAIYQENQGLTKALIRGCHEARGKYIARQDTGDYSYPGRLKRQADFLSLNPPLAICSSWGRMLGPDNEIIMEVKGPADQKLATHELLYEKKGPPGHGSVMFRKDIYEKVGGYRHQFYYAQDSDLWLRMGREGLISYIQDYLYEYKMDYSDISALRRPLQKRYADLADACDQARLNEESEGPYLEQAIWLRSLVNLKQKKHNEKKYKVDFFIGSCLLEQKNARAVMYLWRAFCGCPLDIKIGAKLLWSLFYTR